MKVNKFGRAAILTPTQITLLFEEGFTKPRDKALFGVCLYAAARINEACTLLRGDVIGIKGVRDVLVIRSHNTKGKQSTREIQVHGVCVASEPRITRLPSNLVDKIE